MSAKYNYTEFAVNKQQRIESETRRYSLDYHTKEEAQESLRVKIDKAYHSGASDVSFRDIKYKDVEEVLDEFRKDGLEHIGMLANSVVLDNRWWLQK